MSNKKSAVTEIANTETALEVAGNNQIEAAFKNFEAVKELENSDLIELSSTYLSFAENSTYDLIATGFTTFTDEKGNEKEAVSLINEQKESLINANAVLVNSLKKIGAENLPCFVRINTLSKVKTANGSYMNMKVLRGPAV
jgi:hypothetical protein